MLEPEDFGRDWGPWGWVWAFGLWAFLLGLLFASQAFSGSVPWVTVSIPIVGALLMRVAHGARENAI
ncbi:MAG: hypothetical protein ACE5EW_07345 [Thermoplasmata archaeon]